MLLFLLYFPFPFQNVGIAGFAGPIHNTATQGGSAGSSGSGCKSRAVLDSVTQLQGLNQHRRKTQPFGAVDGKVASSQVGLQGWRRKGPGAQGGRGSLPAEHPHGSLSVHPGLALNVPVTI